MTEHTLLLTIMRQIPVGMLKTSPRRIGRQFPCRSTFSNKIPTAVF